MSVDRLVITPMDTKRLGRHFFEKIHQSEMDRPPRIVSLTNLDLNGRLWSEFIP